MNLKSPPDWYAEALKAVEIELQKRKPSLENEALDDLEPLLASQGNVNDLASFLEQFRRTATPSQTAIVQRGLRKLARLLDEPCVTSGGMRAKPAGRGPTMPRMMERARGVFAARLRVAQPAPQFTLEVIAFLCWWHGWFEHRPGLVEVDALRKLAEKLRPRKRDPKRHSRRDMGRSMK